MKIYLFNPEHDMALASFSPYYKAPAEIIRMKENLAALPVWYSDKGASVCAYSFEYQSLFASQCLLEGLAPYGRLVGEDALRACLMNELPPRNASSDENVVTHEFACCHDFSINKEFCLSPWGWDPALVQNWMQKGMKKSFFPDAGLLERIRILSGRQQCVKVLRDFEGFPHVCGKAQVCSSLEEVKAFLAVEADVILKAPWSGSGRGLTRTSQATWSANLEGWVSRILRTQGAIMAEPIYNKVCDFAIEFQIDENKELSFAGYSLFETDSHGNYKANVLMSNERILERLTQFVSLELLEKVKERLLHSLADLLREDYVGYFGVDMMICEEEAGYGSLVYGDVGPSKIGYCVHPCVEINLRMNMGVVARLLYDRYVAPESEGSYVVEHYGADGEAEEADRQLRMAHPARICGGRMAEGYFSLTPVCRTTRYQCYVLLHDRTCAEV